MRQHLTGRSLWTPVLVATLCGVQFVDVLSTTIVIVVLPEIGADLGLGAGFRDQVVGIYALLFGALLLLAGRMADAWGARRLFLAGLVAFGAGSLAGGLAPDGVTLIAGRAVQGIGAALSVPAALALLTHRFPPGRMRNRVLGIWAATGALGGAAGFVLGGPITEAAGWRWTLLGNVPIVLIAGLALVGIRAAQPARAPGTLAVGQSLALSGGLLGVTFGLSLAPGGALLPLVGTVFAAGMAGLVMFVRGERGSRTLVPRAVWRDRRLTVGSGVAFTLTFATTAAAVPLTLYLQDIQGLSASTAGWLFAAFNVGVVLGSWVGPLLVTARGAAGPMVGGLVGTAAGLLVWLTAMGVGSIPLVLGGMLVGGASLGVASVASTAIAMEDAIEGQMGAASGLVNAAARVGSAIGIATLGAVAIAGKSLALSSGDAATVFGFQAALGFGAVFVALAVLALIRLRARGWLTESDSAASTQAEADAVGADNFTPSHTRREPSDCRR